MLTVTKNTEFFKLGAIDKTNPIKTVFFSINSLFIKKLMPKRLFDIE